MGSGGATFPAELLVDLYDTGDRVGSEIGAVSNTTYYLGRVRYTERHRGYSGTVGDSTGVVFLVLLFAMGIVTSGFSKPVARSCRVMAIQV